MLKDYWLKFRIKNAHTQALDIRNASNYDRAARLHELLNKLPYVNIDASVASLQYIRVGDENIEELIAAIKAINLKLETSSRIPAALCVFELKERSFESLFVANKVYVPFERLAVFVAECGKLIQLSKSLKGAKVGQDEYHFRILGNVFAVCSEVLYGIIQNLKMGKFGS